MSTAYTPGLKVSPSTVLELERRLPIDGEVVVKKGQQVKYDQVVARTQLPGRVDMVNVANRLGLEPAEVTAAMLVPAGGPIQKGQPLARNRGFFGMFKSTLDSPMTGTVESVSAVTGQVVLRAVPSPVEVKAYVDGEIIEVIPNSGVRIRTAGAHIQGIFGIGGETSGILRRLVDDAHKPLTEDLLKPELAGTVVIGGSYVSQAFLEAAARLQVAGVIVGGIDDQDLKDFLGYDLGVAITGSEDKGLTLIITEGFGPIRMAQRTFDLLGSLEGQRASISGATQIRAGVIRPEILVPTSGQGAAPPAELGLGVGSSVRIIREPGFGELARVVELPVDAQEIPTEARVRVAVLELANGERMTLPRANLELVSG